MYLELPPPVSLGLTYQGECAEFAAHAFIGRNGISSLYSRYGAGLGRPIFAFRAKGWRRAVPMYFVTGTLRGAMAHSALLPVTAQV